MNISPRLKRIALLAIPLVGLAELAAHLIQTKNVISESEWLRARDEVRSMLKPDDLVAFAPLWADPLGRRYFGSEIATIERVARPDDSRFPRAIEVSIRGKHLKEFDGWKLAGEKRVGPFTLRTLENPNPIQLKDDLLNHVNLEKMWVARVDSHGEQKCNWSESSVTTGGLGFGNAIPGARFVCPGSGFAGITIMSGLDYAPHRSIYASPTGGNSTLTMHFRDVAFGRSLHGHHGISVHYERDKNGPPVTLTFRTADRIVGKVIHNDGDGWKRFEFETEQLAGQRGELIVDVNCTTASRQYGFEANTR